MKPFEIQSDEPSKELLESLFIYDRVNGQLINKVTRASNCVQGQIAGSLDKHGYIQVTVNYKNYRLHRLCFCMEHGYYPEQVEHIDLVRTNNKPDNLRAAAYSENACNRKVQSNNKSSGLKGISIITVTGGYKYWQARVTMKGCTYRKQFPYSWAGLQFAYDFIKIKRREIHGGFARD